MMMIIGIIALVGALALIGVGVYQWRKLKLMTSAPLAKTGEAAQSANEKGLISVEGAIETPKPLLAPCSGTPCIYYEITVSQKWSEHVRTENGTRTKNGKSNVKTEKVGGIFTVNDGSGPAKVDATDGKVQAKTQKSFTAEGAASGQLTFGNYSVHVPPKAGKGWATGTVVTEKIVPAQGEVYIAGQLRGDTIAKKDNMGGRLIIATEGVESLQKTTKMKAFGSAAAAAVMLSGGGVMAATGDMPEGTAGCTDGIVGDIADACRGRQHDEDPVEFAWTVEEAGTYEVTAVGTGSDRNNRMWPSVTISDAMGAPVLSLNGSGGDPAVAQGMLAPGQYHVSVTEVAGSWANGLEGGAGFSFDADLIAAAEAPAPQAEALLEQAGEAQPEEGAEEGAEQAAGETAEEAK